MTKRKRKLDINKLLKLRKRMLITAQRKFNPNPEDIASEYVLRLLEGLHQHATVEQAYIDIVRGISNSRNKHYQTQLNLERGVKDPDKILPLIACEDELSLDEKLDLEKIVNKIKNSRTKKIFNMRLLGFTLDEIGREIGLTQGMIVQIIDKEIDRVASRLNLR